MLIAYYNIDFMEDTPPWSYLVAAIAVFIYLHLDCLDGKQARATGTSSPLGQLFDHGMYVFIVVAILYKDLTCMGCVCRL